ncbi:MAG TPA: AMP-binding protein [Acidimicrobiia bacterium]|nr:AMP-binding protein [Acidimicrobiia bacterium]
MEWRLRETAPELRDWYRRDGYWTDATLTDLVVDGLERNREREFRVWSRIRPTRDRLGDVAARAYALAAGLARHGVREGDVVAFQLPNCVEAGITFYTAALLGVVLVPVVHFYGHHELGYILDRTEARVLITADAFGHIDYLAGLEQLRPALPALETVAVVGIADPDPALPAGAVPLASLAGDGGDLTPARPDPDAPAVIGFTSGTTAEPKGVIHTHRTIGGELHHMTWMGAMPARPTLVGAPVGHAIGMQGGLLGPLLRDMSVHLQDVWNPGDVLRAMEEAGVTAGSGSTYFLTSLLDHPDCTPRHHELIGSVGMGGSPVPAAVADRAESLGISLLRSYGSTEHPSTTGSRHDAAREQRLYTDGTPMPGVEVRLLDDDGNEVGVGEPGEIVSRGPDLFVCYTEPALTKAAIDDDGWYASGDIGVRDERGAITITDRKKDVIIRGGENISAAEVEELLVRMPGVAEVAVVAAPDERLGEHACAYFRMTPGAPPPDLGAVRAHLETAGLARQKWPEELRVADEFPRTASGKVQKYVLRDRIRQRELRE